MKDKWYKFFDITLCILSLIMMFHFGVQSNGWLAMICLWLFILYFAWYDIYAKNKLLAVIPLWLYLIVYYVVNWETICKVFYVFGNINSNI